MILDEIVIHDFGVYAGTQRIPLTPASEEKPIILIGGLNGGGKTTFLDALQLVLFGPHAKCSNRAGLPYNEYLLRCIHRGNDKLDAGIELSFRRTVEGIEERYRIHRAWRKTGTGCVESFEAFKDDIPEQALADNWATQVEDFFPTNIAHLFLFDGELVEAYASPQDSAALIRSAIQNLLGLDMVDQLDKDLQTYERRKRSQGKGDEADDKIITAEDDLREVRAQIDSLKQERASLQTHSIDKLKRDLEKKDAEYRKIGGSLYDEREALEARFVATQAAVKEGEEALREFAAGSSPLTLVKDQLEQVKDGDDLEEMSRLGGNLADVLKTRDDASIDHLSKQTSDAKIVAALKSFLADDRKRRVQTGKADAILNLNREVRSDLHALLRYGLKATSSEASALLAKQKELRAQEQQARTEFEGIPGSDIIEKVATDQTRDQARSHG